MAKTVIITKNKMLDLYFLLEGNKKTLTATELSSHLGIERNDVYRLISRSRKHYLRGLVDQRIWTTSSGYTLTPSREDVVYESDIRANLISGLISNSMPVFKSCKLVSLPSYKKQCARISNAFNLIKIERIK